MFALSGTIAFASVGLGACKSGQDQSRRPLPSGESSDTSGAVADGTSDVPEGYVKYTRNGQAKLVPVSELSPDRRRFSLPDGGEAPVVEVEQTLSCVTAETVCCGGDTAYYGAGHVLLYSVHGDCFPGH
jgi:hypothetical protein